LAWDEVRKELVRTGKRLDYDMMVELLENPVQKQQVVYKDTIKRDSKTQIIRSIDVTKTLSLSSTKRVIKEDFTTVPFGTRKRACDEVLSNKRVKV
jgi:hypothetical protein